MTRRPVRIVTDSGSDLPPDVAAALQISIVPLVVTIGTQSFADPSLTPDAFWALAARSNASPGTSQPSPGAFYQVFEALVQQGYDVICLTITGRHSGTFSSACMAAQPFGERVTVLDSRALSMAMGYAAMEAARMALDGAPGDAIVTRLASLRQRVRILIHLESLEQVRRGGRAARLMPLVDRLARAMSIKTALTLVEGELRLLGVARSTGKSLIRMAQQIAALGPLEHLIVMHVRAPGLAERLVDLLGGALPVAQGCISVGEAGPVLACHGGPGVVGVGAWPVSAGS
ncbi:MAG: DegV family protein [Anaerolineae bacterium]